MVGRALASAAALLMAAAPLNAAAIESTRPLRSLSFDIDLSISNTVEAPGQRLPSGTASAVVGKGGRVIARNAPVSGSGEKRTVTTFTAKGRITIDVLRQTQDAGLLVEVAEDAASRVHPKVRLDVAFDGSLLYDPAQANDLSEEELALARWLARGFYGDHPTAPGTSWSVDQSLAGRTEIEHYRVIGLEAHQVTLGYALEEKIERVGGYSGEREGSLVYDTALIVPIKGSFAGIARRQVAEKFATQRSSLQFVLTADSFAPRN